MNGEPLLNIGLNQVRSMFSDEIGSCLGDDFFVLDIRYDDKLDFLKYPCRYDGYTAIFCLSGRLTVEINLKSYDLHPHSLLIGTPGNILKVEKPPQEGLDSLRFIVVALSSDYLSGINLDFGKLFTGQFGILADPCLRLEGRNLLFCSRYLELVEQILHEDFPNRREAVGSLIASLFYLLDGAWKDQELRKPESSDVTTSRVKSVFEQFMTLVTEHHNSQHSVAFYADQIGLTPKYLSKLVRQASGRTASDWIDAFLILEVKNLLKYSDIPIKEIVFNLKFSNQSVFCKFFKSHVGMTPKDYRNS